MNRTRTVFQMILFLVPGVISAFGYSDRVLLSDVSVLTLYHGKYTTSRRSSPIPQLKCIGGTAGCSSFTPQVVQCYNRGSDGVDAQWECKTDMDNAYRFGTVQVSCEGYEYSEDPHVLKGSCGLEYTLDLTKEGHQQKHHGGHHNYYGDHNSQSYSGHHVGKKSTGFGDLIMLVIVGVIIYAVYHTCLTTSNQNGGDRYDDGGSRPPPPGFRQEYMPGSDGCSSNYGGTHGTGFGTGYGTRYNTGFGSGFGTRGGGFWTGAATGGILGYLFGNRNNTGYYNQPHTRSPWSTGWGSGFGRSGSSWTSGTGSGFSGMGSSGTRTASGFGGTRRR